MSISTEEVREVYGELFDIFEKRNISANDMLIHLTGFLAHAAYVTSGGDPELMFVTRKALADHYDKLTTHLIERKKESA